MKCHKIIGITLLLIFPVLCQAQKNLFNEYNDMKGVSSVYISKAMIEIDKCFHDMQVDESFYMTITHAENEELAGGAGLPV